VTGKIRFGDSDSMVPRYLQIWFGHWMPVCSLAVVLLAALALGGCGGGDDSSSSSSGSGDEAKMEAGTADKGEGEEKPEADKQDAAPEKPAEAAAAPEKPAEETKPADAAAPPDAAPKKPVQAAKVPAAPSRSDAARPDSVVEWKPEHFLSAKRDRDPRLLDAVAFLGEHRAGDVEVVQLLEDLLLTAEDPEPEPDPGKEPAKKKPADGPDGMMGTGNTEAMSALSGLRYKDEESNTRRKGKRKDSAKKTTGAIAGIGALRMSGSGRQPEKSTHMLTPSYVSLIGGIVGALGANGTDASRQVLGNLLAGKLELGDDVVATSAALKALVDNPCLDNEAILYRALTVPETFRLSAKEKSESPAVAKSDPPKPSQEEKSEPEKTETVTAEMLRATTLPLIEKSASMRLRVELTKYLFGTPAVELQEPLTEMIMASNPLNVAAQIEIYGQEETDRELKGEFETYFTTYSASALGRILGVSTVQRKDLPSMDQLPQMRQPGGSAANGPRVAFGKKSTTPDNRRPFAPGGGLRLGGNDEDMKDGKRGAARSPARRATDSGRPFAPGGGLRFGGDDEDRKGGMPGAARSPARRATEPAPADIASAKAFAQQSSADPGLPYTLIRAMWHASLLGAVAEQLGGIESLEDRAQLISLASTVPNDEIRSRLYKALHAHWKEGPFGLEAAAELPKFGVTDPGFLTVVKMLPRKQRPARRPGAAKQSETSPEDQSSYDWLQTSFDMFKDLCTRFHVAALNESGRKSAALKNLPFKLHADADPVAAFQVDWQARVGNKAPGVRLDILKVSYVRIEETGQYATRRSFYARAAKPATQRDLDTGVWFDGIGEGSQPGLKRTIDILITRSEKGEEDRDRQEEPLVIEILSIEVKDPTAG
jgi:hypothetical protein